MKLLIDMNLSPKWTSFLASHGFNAVHWMNVGAVNAPDSELMGHARAGDYVVLTNDLDFGAILAVTHGDKPSVVQLRSDTLTHETIGRQVIDALRQLEIELAQGALVTIEPERTRLRILPLQSNAS